jgi:large subunit ribosomal protein L23
MRAPEIIIRKPLLTEKFTPELEDEPKNYAFEVLRNANKIEIKNAVETRFNVNVEKVRTIVVKGKSKRMNTRRGMTFGKRPTWKKAIVTLEEGYQIDFLEAV